MCDPPSTIVIQNTVGYLKSTSFSYPLLKDSSVSLFLHEYCSKILLMSQQKDARVRKALQKWSLWMWGDGMTPSCWDKSPHYTPYLRTKIYTLSFVMENICLFHCKTQWTWMKSLLLCGEDTLVCSLRHHFKLKNTFLQDNPHINTSVSLTFSYPD